MINVPIAFLASENGRYISPKRVAQRFGAWADRLNNEGMTSRDIARLTGWGEATVGQAIRDHRAKPDPDLLDEVALMETRPCEIEEFRPPSAVGAMNRDDDWNAVACRRLGAAVLITVLSDYNRDYHVALKRTGGSQAVLLDLVTYLRSEDGQIIQELAGVIAPIKRAVSLVKLPRRKFRDRLSNAGIARMEAMP